MESPLNEAHQGLQCPGLMAATNPAKRSPLGLVPAVVGPQHFHVTLLCEESELESDASIPIQDEPYGPPLL